MVQLRKSSNANGIFVVSFALLLTIHRLDAFQNANHMLLRSKLLDNGKNIKLSFPGLKTSRSNPQTPTSTGLNILKSSEQQSDPNNIFTSAFQNLFPSNPSNPQKSAVERYFEAWNQRDMDTAVNCFTDDCTYDDTQYAEPFEGKPALRKHLLRVAANLPQSFEFVIDDLAVSANGQKVGVQWHVENDGEALPFTRGCSFYTCDPQSGLIQSGFDVPEPAVIKPGSAGLNLLSLASKVIDEPVRAIPLLLWGTYIYVVFFSNGILPGADALQLEQRTWEEVRDLSLNFFLVSPILHLPFAPVIHPGLEAIFNLLLSWAAMFAGFLSDERERKPNLLPMFPIVVGMQFLTSAFYLPYLASRTSEDLDTGEVVYKEDLGPIERTVGESRILGPLLGFVGTGSIFWGFFARQAEFGNLQERYASLIDILSIDRVGSSFIVDLIIFGLFQGWLVDDDLKRRGVSINNGLEDVNIALLRGLAKYVPFFGLAIYLTFRPGLQSKELS